MGSPARPAGESLWGCGCAGKHATQRGLSRASQPDPGNGCSENCAAHYLHKKPTALTAHPFERIDSCLNPGLLLLPTPD